MENPENTPETQAGTGTNLFSAPAPTTETPPTTEPAAPVVEEEVRKPVDEMTDEEKAAAEKKALRERAKLMGLNPSPNASVDTLRAQIQAKIDGDSKPAESEVKAAEPAAPVVNPLEQATQAPINKSMEQAAANAVQTQEAGKPLTKMQQRQLLLADAMRLIRVRISNLDPKKKDLPGEIITVANGVIGTVRKFIPFGEATDEGYHIPNILYQHLKERTFVQVRQVRDRRTGTNRTETRDVREFSIEVLPPLTQAELEQLATAQTAAGSID